MKNKGMHIKPVLIFSRTSTLMIFTACCALLLFQPLFAQTKEITIDQNAISDSVQTASQKPLLFDSTLSPRADIGYVGYNYGNTVVNAPTGEKPESKLWWNDDIWWGSMWDPAANEYRIYRLNTATQTWENTGVSLDDRSTTKADALWDGNKLYVASHVFDEGGGNAGPNEAARLYRYSYNNSAKEYTLDNGFPVEINSATSETLVIDKDSGGKLWITWTQSGKVWINASTTDDLHWNTPIQLPVQSGTAKSDDISSLQHFDDNKIGLMWSDQNARTMFFAIHLDGAAFNNWQPAEVALDDAGNAAVADDHINLKMGKDGLGNLYAVTKTSLSDSEDPLIYLLKRDRFGTWTSAVFGYDSDRHTRPILLIDESNDLLYVFATGSVSGVNSIYMKTSDINNISFPSGVGTPFIQNSGYDDINNPTSTKQTINNRMGLVVLASDATQNVYFHNTIPASVSVPVIASFTPASGIPGTEVTISGENFNGASAVKFNGLDAASFTVISDEQIQAEVPAGAATGPISVHTPDGSAISNNNFVVLIPPQITTFAPDTGPAGTEVNISGSGFSTTLSVEFNGVSAVSFNIIADDQLTAVVPAGASSGPISLTNAIGTATSAGNFIIPEPPFTLSVFSNGPGTVQLFPEPDLTGGIYNSITEVTLTAVPDPGYVFAGWSGDLSGAANPGTILVNTDKSVTASFIEEGGGGGPVVFEEIRTGGSSSSVTVSIYTPLALVNDDLYLAAISFKNYTPVESVSGLNLTWTLVMEQCGGRSATGVSVWMAQGNPGGNGIVTATLSSAPTNAVIAVSRYSGVNNITPLGTVISGNTNGLSGGCSGGADLSTYNLDFNTTQQGSVIFGAVAIRNRTHTPGSGYTERVETTHGSGGDMAGLAIVDREVANPALVPLNGSFSGDVDWAVVGVELIPGGGMPYYTLTVDVSGGGTVSLDPAVPGNSYTAGTTVTLTANPDPGFQFEGWSGDLGGLANPETIVMDGDKSVTAAFGPLEISIVNVKAFLEGPYRNGSMNTVLRDNGGLPLAQPYNTSPWNYSGSEAVAAIPAGVVDWVLVGLRSTATGSEFAHRAAFIKSDGSIVETGGSGGVEFAGVAHGNYFVVIYHRNHLGIMSNNALPLSDNSALYNFSTASTQAYGSNPMSEIETGVFGMFSGDGNADGTVNGADRLLWRPENGTAWSYDKGGDFNLDGGIDASDLNDGWRGNDGTLTGVPGVTSAPLSREARVAEKTYSTGLEFNSKK